MNKLLLLIKASRPVFWIIIPLVFLTGTTTSGAQISFYLIFQLLLLSFPLCILIYGINDVYDYASDKLNPRKKLIEGIVLKPKYHQFVKNVSLFAAVVLFISSFFTFNMTNVLVMILLLFFSYFYSSPPLRLKEKPPFDSISNGIIYFFAPFLLGFGFGNSILNVSYVWYLVTLCVMGVHAFTTIMDYTSDKKVGHKTFSVVFGKRTASLVPLILFTLTFFLTNFSVPTKIYIIFGVILFLTTLVHPSERLSALFVRLLFVGFIINRIAVFLISV